MVIQSFQLPWLAYNTAPHDEIIIKTESTE